MEHIKIPSPSAILDAPMSSRSSPKRPSNLSNHIATSTNKPKQSKSRNGCITCKTKRLKCDESKPTCLQCKKRNVQCGGYKKDFKWRPFEETNLASKANTNKKRVSSSYPPSNGPGPNFSTSPTDYSGSAPGTRKNSTASSTFGHKDHGPIQFLPTEIGISGRPNDPPPQKDPLGDMSGPILDSFDDNILSSPLDFSPPNQSPWLSDLFLASGELDQVTEQSPFAISLQHSPSKSDSFSFSALLEGDNEDIQEIVQQSNSVKPWVIQRGRASHHEENNAGSLLREPGFNVGSPEMLILRFDRFTCGILSVKDGVNENPWRTLIWPLAKDSPALYHAIFSLAAFHSCKENPALRVFGVDHMRQSITYMVQDIQNMRTDAALATSLALAFADTWDQHTQTCIQHIRGAKALVSQVLKAGAQGGMHGTELERVRFLYNTWLYMDVIARLTSREECGDREMDFSVFNLPKDAVHEVDPLMGCAATLFPLINRVTKLIQRVRRSESNSLSVVSQAIELKGLLERWEPPRWFEPPEDPTSEVQHSIQTAHAYRWATLLYLHQAVPEMPSEPASELAKRVLILLATVPPSSRTTIIQMFPLLAAGCEADQDEDRTWVLDRWRAIQTRLMLGGIDRCIDVVREVWSRQDAYKVDRHQLDNRNMMLDKTGKNKSQGERVEQSNELFGLIESLRRRSVADDRAMSTIPRRKSAVSPLENIEFERTVRGRLHWINVMEEWGWEVFLG